MDYILTTENLTKRYGSTYAANKVNLQIRKGEIYGLIGRNGAGKTTILRIISGLSNATSGSYSICGKTGRKLADERKKIGSLIESPGLYPDMSGYDNLKLKCIAVGKNNKAYIDSLFATVGLTRAAHKKVRGYSLGMRQRLGIAMALAGEPEILVLDEPINGLDPQGIVEIREILTKLSEEKNITIIVSSHILEELAKIADSIGIIHEGKLIEQMSLEQLKDQCGEFVNLCTSDNDKAEKLLTEMGIQTYERKDEAAIKITGNIDKTEAIVNQLVKANVGVKEIYISRYSLEEYYLNLTGGPNHA